MIAAAVLAVIVLTHPDNIGAFLGGLLAAATVVVAPVVTMTTSAPATTPAVDPPSPDKTNLIARISSCSC